MVGDTHVMDGVIHIMVGVILVMHGDILVTDGDILVMAGEVDIILHITLFTHQILMDIRMVSVDRLVQIWFEPGMEEGQQPIWLQVIQAGELKVPMLRQLTNQEDLLQVQGFEVLQTEMVQPQRLQVQIMY